VPLPKEFILFLLGLGSEVGLGGVLGISGPPTFVGIGDVAGDCAKNLLDVTGEESGLAGRHNEEEGPADFTLKSARRGLGDIGITEMPVLRLTFILPTQPSISS